MKKRKLFYKGEEISSEDAHKLDAKERVHLTGRKSGKIKKEKNNGTI